MPSATTTRGAWLPGRASAATPCRQARPRARGSRRALAMTTRASTHSASSAAIEAPTKIAPILSEPACQRASAERPATTGRSVRARPGPRRPGATSRRSTSHGGTERTAASGAHVQSSVVPSPIAIARTSVHTWGRGSSVNGTRPASAAASKRLDGQTEGRAGQARDERHGLRLQHVGHDERPRVGAESLQDRQGRRLAGHEGRHRRGHADAADEETGQSHQPQVHRQLSEEAPQARLGLVVRGHAHGRAGDLARQRRAHVASEGPRGQADQHAVADAAAEAHQARALERVE